MKTEEETIIGKKILVGLTYLESNGEIREQVQLHGFINGISENTLSFDRSDGEGDFSIPFEGELETSDEEAIYILRTTGEEVSGVNFISSFTIHPPENENS